MKTINTRAKLDYFLQVYFYEIEQALNNHKEELSKVKFQSEESNTDEYIKRFMKQFILEHSTIEKSALESILIKNAQQEISVKLADFNEFKITQVFLPEELSIKQRKEISKNKKSVYTNPDLLLQIEGYDQLYNESLELKSTNNNKIPGASVQQVLPLEWVVFIRRTKDKVSVTTGQYINSITNKLPFPDRSPRPQIAFKTLKQWNKENRILVNKQMQLNVDSALVETKLNLLKDWQDFLADEWLTIIQQKKKGRTEKWFNNALRKFAVKLLNYSTTLNEKERKQLINDLNNLIE